MKGIKTVLWCQDESPLENWHRNVINGHIKRICDPDIQSNVLEIMGTDVNTCFLSAPVNQKKKLGIDYPYITFVIKNVQESNIKLQFLKLKKFFSVSIEILDDKNIKRKFIANNFQVGFFWTTTRVKPFVCSMPMTLEDGWNQININLMDFTKKAYGTDYRETLKVQIHANCRVRRIYFSDRLYQEKDLPKEFRLFVPNQDNFQNNP